MDSRRVHITKSLLMSFSLLLLLSALTLGQEKAPTAAENYFTNTELINQNGQTVRFYQDALKDKVVVINTFFATCTGVCPPMNQNIRKIQDAFASKMGKELILISITVDPITDTPQRLKAYAANLHAGNGWLFLTGKKENVDLVLKKLGQYVEKKEDHLTILIIGNEKTGLWKKAFGLAKASELVAVVEGVLVDQK
jgi:protein SCO1